MRHVNGIPRFDVRGKLKIAHRVRNLGQKQLVFIYLHQRGASSLWLVLLQSSTHGVAVGPHVHRAAAVVVGDVGPHAVARHRYLRIT